MKKFRKGAGITLVALVVTIIVLLILAGVSLNLVSGSDGILGRASNAADRNNVAKAGEEVELLMSELQSEYYEKVYVNRDSTVTEKTADSYVIAHLDGETTASGYTVDVEGTKLTVKDGSDIIASNEFESTTLAVLKTGWTGDKKGKSGGGSSSGSGSGSGSGSSQVTPTTKPDTETSSESVALSNQISAQQYGMETNYQVTVNGVVLGNKAANSSETYMIQNLNVWKLFYKDSNNNIYLIYGDYLPTKCVPTEALNAGIKSVKESMGGYPTLGINSSEPYGPITFGSIPAYYADNRLAMVDALSSPSYWSATFGKKIQGYDLTASGTPTLEQFIASCGEENMSIMSSNSNGISSYRVDKLSSLLFPRNDDDYKITGYWLGTSHTTDSTTYLWCASYNENPKYEWASASGATLFATSYNSSTFGIRPVVCIPNGVTGVVGTSILIDD